MSNAALPSVIVFLTVDVMSLVIVSNCGRLTTEWNLSARLLKSCNGSIWVLGSAATMLEDVISKIQNRIGREPFVSRAELRAEGLQLRDGFRRLRQIAN